jgi:hypothetical protein
MLMDLLFDNLFFVVILFSVVSFLVNKIRGAASPTHPPRRNTMPPFGGEGPFAGGSTAEPSEVGGRMSRGEPVFETAPSTMSSLEPSYVQEALYEQRLTEEREIVPPPPMRKATPRPALARPSSDAANHTMSLHARNAAQGMIWSEVFGPPRARRPHDSRRR